jgi:hypothetical protein
LLALASAVWLFFVFGIRITQVIAWLFGYSDYPMFTLPINGADY